MRSDVLLATAILAVATTGCTGKGEPSPQYAQAQDEFNQLYGRYLEDAYVRPEMDAVAEKLRSVPQKSSDYVRSQQLLKRIESGRERKRAELEERQRLVEQAAQPAPDFAFTETAADRPDAGGQGEAVPDAGAAEHPVAGMPIQEMLTRFGDCFVSGEDIEVRGRGYRPTWVLRETAYCLQHHPGYERKIVFGEGPHVLFIGDRSKVERVSEDAGVPPSTDAGGN